jgi:N-acetylmuramic acid 6-phosphate etherase
VHQDAQPITEQTNPATATIDTLSAAEIIDLISAEDQKPAQAVRAELPNVTRAVKAAVDGLRAGGRLLYFGAGTSGRLGVLDASEIPPTYGAPPELVQGFIAGGDISLRNSTEGAEDDWDAGRELVQALNVGQHDVVVGIAASGTTPWVLGALEAASACAATTVGISCNPGSPLSLQADIAITPVVGPEVIAGSSRMKAGTAQKMVLNMLSTATMVRLGKVYGNLMVDVQPGNSKLRNRAVRILQQAARVDEVTANTALEQSGWAVKPALVMLLAGVDAREARTRLAAADGFVRKAVTLK